MRCVIGCEYTPKENAPEKYKHSCGIYAIAAFDFPVILCRNALKKYDIPYFKTAEDAESFSQYLSRIYRQDDSIFNKRKSFLIRRFYPVKFNSMNFPLKIDVVQKSVNKEFCFNRFAEKTDKPTLRYGHLTIK